MSIASITASVQQIESQLASLQTAFVPPAKTSATASTAATTSGSVGSDFSSMLSSALGSSTPTTTDVSDPLGTGATATTTGGAAVSTATLPSRASTMLTSGQRQFASHLASETGLDPGVVSAWLLAEESGGAAVSRQSANNNDWLNVGYTDSATYGSSDSIWSDPVKAADATAGWLKGRDTIPGYGTASSGVQAILRTAGETPSTQISALQGSGWASSGYPDLPSLYAQVAG